MKKTFILFFLFFNAFVFGQDTQFILAKLIEVKPNLELILTNRKGEKYLFEFYEFIPINEKHREIKDYILRKLDGEFYIEVEKIVGNKVWGGIFYDCIENTEQDQIENLPCLSARNIQLELIMKKFYIYTGNDYYLKRLIKTLGND